jgi:tRNA U34 2-thiouridine synthase MnmA/TrmU
MKAIALISGGLDSILAARLIKDEGVEIFPLHFKIPFYHRDKEGPSKGNGVTIASLVENNLGQKLKIVDIGCDFLELVKNPQHGFGANINPCIDCKILMLSKAKELMEQCQAKFIVTGEVLGQRPMSQHRQALDTIAKNSGLEGLVLRPLSGKLLFKTLPEREGWIKRERLLSFSGRGRKSQIELAKVFRVREYAQPAGGCLLTDPEFAKKTRDLLEHNELNLNNIELLKIGRHFRLSPETKLVVGRDENENGQLANLAQENDYLFMPGEELAGPTSLGRGRFNEELIGLSCSITSRYCDLNGSNTADIFYKSVSEKENKVFKASPINSAYLNDLKV